MFSKHLDTGSVLMCFRTYNGLRRPPGHDDQCTRRRLPSVCTTHPLRFRHRSHSICLWLNHSNRYIGTPREISKRVQKAQRFYSGFGFAMEQVQFTRSAPVYMCWFQRLDVNLTKTKIEITYYIIIQNSVLIKCYVVLFIGSDCNSKSCCINFNCNNV